MVNYTKKVSIIGAGNVGSAFAFALMTSADAREIVLVDTNKNKALGEALDLSHIKSFISPVEITSGNIEKIKNSDIVVVTAGKNQEVGQTRMDLIEDNTKIFKSLIPQICNHAPGAILIIVTNPVDIMSYVAYKISGFSAEKVIGSGTVLDTSRLRSLLSIFYNLDARNIHSYVIGEHGNSEFPAWSKFTIAGERYENCNLVDIKQKDLDKVFEDVKNSADIIIKAKGATSYGIAMSLVKITKAILRNERSILPVCNYINDYLDIKDVYLSLPALIGINGVEKLLKLQLLDSEKQKLSDIVKIIKDALKKIGF